MNLQFHQKEYALMQFDPSRVPEGTSILLEFIFFLYICGRVVRIDPLMKEETRTPFPTTFCSGLQKTGKMKTINLTQGQVALVDDADYDFLMQWKWHINKSRSRLYAIRHGWDTERKVQTAILMHRVIMNPPVGMLVDHIDHNGLNCQRYNMRVCTFQQNMMNKKPWARSKFSGVYYPKNQQGTEYIIAAITYNKKYYYLGTFKTEELAARAYDAKAKELFGEFAYLNFKE